MVTNTSHDPGTEQGHDSEGAAGGEATESGEAEALDEPNQSLTKDEIFAVLKNSRRRDSLRYLEDNEGSADLGELAEHIAAKENDLDVSEISSSQRKRVYIGLYQVHLPKMDDIEVIDFNKHRGTIELTPAAHQLYPYLHYEPGAEDDEGKESISDRIGSIGDTISGLIGNSDGE